MPDAKAIADAVANYFAVDAQKPEEAPKPEACPHCGKAKGDTLGSKIGYPGIEKVVATN